MFQECVGDNIVVPPRVVTWAVTRKLRFVFSLNEHNLLFDEINEEQREEWRAWLWVVTAHIW